MSEELHPPLARPKNGYVYEVLGVYRVSDPGPGKQDERSLQDQEAADRRWLDGLVGSAGYRLTAIAGSGSGESLERAEYQRVIDEVASGRYDLVRCEDLGRIVRRIHAHLICEHCEDHDTRLVARNDHVDTALPSWREASIFAAFHHERSNRDTSERIKRTHRNRFANGGCLHEPPYGWIKPQGSKNDSQLVKDPAAERIYTEWFRMLDVDAASYAEVARWLRSEGVTFPTRTPGVRRAPYGKSVARHTFNVLLKSVRERNRRKSKRINNPGKYVSKKADPHDLLQRRVPHLAFFEEAYYDRVVAAVRARNCHFRRSDDPARDPCRHRPRRQTRYPGGLTVCEICRFPFVWGGHGQTDHMMCGGAREHRCWNGVTFDGALAAARITSEAHAAIEELEGFDPAFLRLVHDEAGRLDEDRQRRIDGLTAQLGETRLEVQNLLRFVRGGDSSVSVREDLKQSEQREADLASKLTLVEREPTHTVDVPEVQQLKELGRDCLQDLDHGSEAFARVLRRLVPRVSVFPVRLCDGGRVVLRGRLTIRLSELLVDGKARDVLRRPLERERTIDLFDPPQRAVFRKQVSALRASGLSERAAAAELGITVTAAQAAIKLQRRMDVLNVSDPYVLVGEPPVDCSKLRRHLHPDYRFEPLMLTRET